MTRPQPGDIYVDIGSTVEETSYMFMVLDPGSHDGIMTILWLRHDRNAGQIRYKQNRYLSDYYFKVACLSDEI